MLVLVIGWELVYSMRVAFGLKVVCKSISKESIYIYKVPKRYSRLKEDTTNTRNCWRFCEN